MASLSELVQVMSQPGFYPHNPSSVEIVQTQMSIIFLTGQYVFKIKKPVNLGYLDYTTLDKRRFFCEQEVVLNRRLCPDAYLDVIPVTLLQGKYYLEGPGEVVEYAVKMKQLPRDRTLNSLLGQDKVTLEMLGGLAQKIALFHQGAATSPIISSFGNLEMISRNVEENLTQTEKYTGVTISPGQWQRLKVYSRAFLERNTNLFSRRMRQGKIRDCHGDLHSANICFTNGICIFDCIEFNDRFRYGDVASELAFPAMDIDYYGRSDLSDHLVNTYVPLAGDSQLLELLDFYKCYRACVRAKVNCFKLDDPLVPEGEKKTASDTARRYFGLAQSYTLKYKGPILIIMMGLVGTGKTVLARAVSEKTGAAVVSSDVTRKQLLDIPLRERHFDQYASGLYSQDITRQTYDQMFSEAKSLLKSGKPVILDASFRKSPERQAALAVARQEKARFLLVECRTSEEEIRKRLAKRLMEGSVSDGRWDVYEKQLNDTDPVLELLPAEHLIVDTTQPLTELTNSVLNRWGWWDEQ